MLVTDRYGFKATNTFDFVVKENHNAEVQIINSVDGEVYRTFDNWSEAESAMKSFVNAFVEGKKVYRFK